MTMGTHTTPAVTLRDGTVGEVEVWEPDHGEGAKALVSFEDGVRVWVPVSALVPLGEGRYALPLDRAQLESSQTVIPIVTEDLRVSRRAIETGVVRLRKVVHEREEVVAPMITREVVSVERTPVGRIIDSPIAPRQEGDTVVVPVLEEVLVVEKRLRLVEELRVTVRREQRQSEPQRVTLRREELVVERVPAPPEKVTEPI